MLTDTTNASTQGTVAPPSLFSINRKDLLVLGCVTVVAYAICFLITLHFKEFWYSVLNSNDSVGYIAIARCLRTWDPKVLGHPTLFWGTGYAILAVSSLTGGNLAMALVVVSVISCLVSIFFSYRLFGIGVAAWFVFIDPAMMSRSMLGGAEPLFIALFLGAMVALRKKAFYLAVLLAALATTVRPIGAFLVLSILFVALRNRQWAQLQRGAAVTAAVGLLYCLPLLLLFGDPLANVRGYQVDWFQSSLPISIPLIPLIRQVILSVGKEPLSNIVRLGTWVMAVLFIVIYMGFVRGEIARRWKKFPAETLGNVLFVLFCFSYNSSWAWAEFPRFIAPAVPFVLALVGTERLYSKALWAATPIFGALGATYIVGFQRVAQSLRAMIG